MANVSRIIQSRLNDDARIPESIAAKQRRWATPREYAEYRRVSLSQVNKERCYGTGCPFYKVGRQIYYDLNEVDEWMATHRKSNTCQYIG